jgi:hypothetical protein
VRKAVLYSSIPGQVASRKRAVIAAGSCRVVIGVLCYTHDGVFGEYGVQVSNLVWTFRMNEYSTTLWLLSLEEGLYRLCRESNCVDCVGRVIVSIV